MALKPRFSGLHLLFRLLGLTGLFVLAVSGALLLALPEEFHEKVLLVVYGAAIAVGLALLVEVRVVVHLFGSRRAALGSNVLLQVLLAMALVAGANFWSYLHYLRFDWTVGKEFTLPPEVRAQLGQLRGETDIVVLQQYVQRGDAKEDKYDLAAHKKIVEKVQDLAELFQDLGARFRVVLLDIQNDNFDAKMRELKNEKPVLAEAIEKAPENSIFFHANGKVQRLAFHDVYQIDKRASQEDNDGQGNLVLNYQGVGPIARRILNIEERVPRIANAVVHPVLTMSDQENLYLTMNGAKKVLDAYGFDCKDLLMRKMEEGGGLSQDAAVLTFQEGRYEQIEEELALANEALEKMEKSQVEATRLLKLWRDSTLAELNKTYCYVIFQGGGQGVLPRTQLDAVKKSGRPFKVIDVDDDDKQAHNKAYDRELVILQAELDMTRTERDSLVKERKTLNVDALAEKRRISDVEIKMKRELADRDLLIIPRVTAINIPRGTVIGNPGRVHKLDAAQLQALKYFLKEGKSVLFLLGPTNEPEDESPLRESEIDELEKLVAELGFSMPKQTILFNAEIKDYNERKAGVIFAAKETEIPSMKFEWSPEGLRRGRGAAPEKSEPHPVRTSMNLTNRAMGKQKGMELRVRHPRPVYVTRLRRVPMNSETVATMLGLLPAGGWQGVVAAGGAFLGQNETGIDDGAVLFVAGDDSWNEEQPFISKKAGVPRYEPAKDDDPKKNTLEEERRGPFPVGVAVERAVPSTWFDDAKEAPKARIAVIGSGGIFTGKTLSPIQEKLLLDVVNWLVGRDDLLARESQPWKYPRVHLPDWQVKLWQMGAVIGLPLLFLFLGGMMWLVRSMR